MPSSPIRKLAKYADEAKRNGVHVYHLNIGQPDIQTPECALEAVRAIDRKVLEYSPSQGYKSLRTKMVGYYAEYGIDLSPDEIIVTTGGSINSGASLAKNHLYMSTIPDRTLASTTETAKLLVRGGYTIVDAG